MRYRTGTPTQHGVNNRPLTRRAITAATPLDNTATGKRVRPGGNYGWAFFKLPWPKLAGRLGWSALSTPEDQAAKAVQLTSLTIPAGSTCAT